VAGRLRQRARPPRRGPQRLVVPAPAIQRGPGGVFTWVVKPEGVAEARPITVGPTTADQTIVASGLAEGERVVVNGQYKLRLGSRVTVNEPPPPAVAKQDRSSRTFRSRLSIARLRHRCSFTIAANDQIIDAEPFNRRHHRLASATAAQSGFATAAWRSPVHETSR
jgi:hypothetical protein